jgi:hypothetical protein
MEKVTFLVSNSADEMHCAQAAFRMVVVALTGSDPGADLADRLTGFVSGRGTWQFRMLLAFAGLGLEVVDHEQFDVTEFVHDPEGAIRKQVNDETVALQIIADTDIVAEAEALRKCLESPLVSFIDSAPTLPDMRDEIGKGALLICNVNRNSLLGKPGHLGHYLVVESIDNVGLRVHDPGPPGRLGVELSIAEFLQAWAHPSPTMANYLSIRVAER